MDSQENTLGQKKTEEMLNGTPADNSNLNGDNTTVTNEKEETSLVNEIAETPSAETDLTEQRKVYKSKKEVIERMKEIAHSDDNPKKDEIDYLKTAFYKLHFAEREADMKAYLEAGGTPEL